MKVRAFNEIQKAHTTTYMKTMCESKCLKATSGRLQKWKDSTDKTCLINRTTLVEILNQLEIGVNFARKQCIVIKLRLEDAAQAIHNGNL